MVLYRSYAYKLLKAFALLGAALDASATDPEDALGQAALAKTFESTFEYVWEHFKREADQAGLKPTALGTH